MREVVFITMRTNKRSYQLPAPPTALNRVSALRRDVLEVANGWTVLGDAHGNAPHRIYFLTFRYAPDALPALYTCTCRRS